MREGNLGPLFPVTIGEAEIDVSRVRVYESVLAEEDEIFD